MWKAALAGTAALAIVGSSLVYAQQRGGPGGFDRGRPNLEDLRAFQDARLAALHAGAALWHHFVTKDSVLRRMWPSAPDQGR